MVWNILNSGSHYPTFKGNANKTNSPISGIDADSGGVKKLAGIKKRLVNFLTSLFHCSIL